LNYFKMILTGEEIKRQVKLGNIHINPFCEKFLNPNSYNYRLGPELLEVEDKIIDPRIPYKTRKIIIDSQKGFMLKPHRLYLGRTYEEIGSKEFVTILIGRSSVGRLGLFLQITADLGHIGCKHCWTLELRVVQPLIVYPYMRIGQVSFWVNYGPKDKKYLGEYGMYSMPYPSKFYKEFKNDTYRRKN